MMHASAQDITEKLIRKYVLREKRGCVIEVGSRRRNSYDWTPRQMFSDGEAWEYIGVDIQAGENVNVVVPLRGDWPEHLQGAATSVVSVNCLEHCDRPWEVVCNAAATLKVSGTIILVAPFMWHVHDHPGDFYRFTGNGLAALMEYAGIAPCEFGETPWPNPTVCKRDAYCVGRRLR